VLVQRVPGPDGPETFRRARSADRRAKAQALHERFTARREAGLQKLPAAAASARRRDSGVAHRRVGRLPGPYGRAAGAFDVQITPLAQPQGQVRRTVTWTRNERGNEGAAWSEGCYLLRWKARAQGRRGAGLGAAPRTGLEELAKLKSGDVVRWTPTGDGQPGKRVRVRCGTTPAAAQPVRRNRRGLILPQRRRYLEEVARMESRLLPRIGLGATARTDSVRELGNLG